MAGTGRTPDTQAVRAPAVPRTARASAARLLLLAVFVPASLLAVPNFGSLPAYAEQAPSDSHTAPPPVRASRLAARVAIDGLLNEPAWQAPPAVTRFIQQTPVEGAAPSESTWVWIAYDDDAFYVAARMWDAHPDSIVAPLARRDTQVPADFLGVLLDPFDDHRTGYEFTVTAAGELLDATLYNDGNEDFSWDGVWEGRAQRDASGWTCEMRIPFSQLRFPARDPQAWGVNIGRCLMRHTEKDFVVFTPRAESGFQWRFPHLEGFELAHRRRSVEVSPYLTGKAQYLVRLPGDPFEQSGRYTPQQGGDLRMSAGSNLTLNATVNPDFGQVEVDPAVVNLSDVESFFQEKRPFFTENSGVFRFGREGANNYTNFNWPEPVFFYSRRIGRAPQGSAPAAADFVDAPMATHILGAAKLTGKLTPSVNFGVLGALTPREEARYALGAARAEAEVEPPTYYGVARGLKEFRGGYNGLGLMTTLVRRNLDGGTLDGLLNSQSLMTGLDGWHFLDRRKVWVLSGWTGMSRVAGTGQRMIGLQRDPRHYLQRPDAKHLGVDSSATSLAGYGARLALNKQEGNVTFNAAAGFMDPKFDVNDMGYQSHADILNYHAGAGYQFSRANAWRRNAAVQGFLYEAYDFDGDRTGAGLFTFTQTSFTNDWGLSTQWMYCPRIMNPFRSRGGPLVTELPGTFFSVDFNTAGRKRLVYSIHVDRTYTPAANGTDYWTLSPAVEWKPAAGLNLQAGPTLQRVVEDAQYVGRVPAPGEVPADFGDRRYVFARMNQTTVAADIRVSVSFSTHLTLQTYIQPLISAAGFGDFKELAHAGTYEFVHYGRDAGSAYADGVVNPGHGGTPFALGDPSFNVRSLRGNAVLRWEYRQGSVLYFVWTQQRTDADAIGELRLGPSTRRLFDANADNVFLVKATYHLSV